MAEYISFPLEEIALSPFVRIFLAIARFPTLRIPRLGRTISIWVSIGIDGYSDGKDTIQGTRTMDDASGTFTTPDAFSASIHDPLSQKPYMWNRNNPFEYSDPSGFSPERMDIDAEEAVLGARLLSEELDSAQQKLIELGSTREEAAEALNQDPSIKLASDIEKAIGRGAESGESNVTLPTGASEKTINGAVGKFLGEATKR